MKSDDTKNTTAPMTDHEYDGIRELDNKLPQWWLASFYITIIFSVFYVMHYEFGSGLSIDDEFEKEVTALEVSKSTAPTSSFPNLEKLGQIQKDPSSIGKAKAVYAGKCASCHGNAGQGNIGPNLADSYWIHGNGSPEEIAKVIQNGVPEKGMPPWGALLSEEEVYSLATYIHSIKGSNPPGAKAPQGTKF